jgi:hypothetical protein
LLNGAFSNGFFNKLLLNYSAIFFGLTFALTFVFFAPTDCPSHRSLFPIQRYKNENLKTEIPQITNPFSFVFIYKREMRERKKR